LALFLLIVILSSIIPFFLFSISKGIYWLFLFYDMETINILRVLTVLIGAFLAIIAIISAITYSSGDIEGLGSIIFLFLHLIIGIGGLPFLLFSFKNKPLTSWFEWFIFTEAGLSLLCVGFAGIALNSIWMSFVALFTHGPVIFFICKARQARLID
jgi:hypothetical protein